MVYKVIYFAVLTSLFVFFRGPTFVLASEISICTKNKSKVTPFTVAQQASFEGLLSSKLEDLDVDENILLENIVIFNSVENDCKRISNTVNIFDCTSTLSVKIETRLLNNNSSEIIKKVSAIGSVKRTKRVKGIDQSVPWSLFEEVVGSISSTIANKMRKPILNLNKVIKEKKDRDKDIKYLRENINQIVIL